MRLITSEEAKDWDIVADHYNGIENITEEQKEKAKKAFLFLKKELGANYLKEIETNHPIYFNIINHVVSSRLWFIDLAADIKRLKGYPNYKALHRRLIKPLKFPEAFSVLEIAIKFCKVGFKIEFDPKILVNDKQKEPDLKVMNSSNDESLYCEVSVLNTADIEKDAMNTELKLFYAIIFSSSVEFAGRVEKILTNEEINDISSKITELKKKIKDTGFEELIIKNVLTLGLSTEENKDRLIIWAKEHNCEIGNFEPPHFESRELQRMKSKITDERKQLPYEKPNLIMIYDNDFFYRCGNIFYAVDELEKYIGKYKNIAGIIIRGKVVANIEPLIGKIKQHIFIQKYQYDTYSEQYLILWNSNCYKPLKRETTIGIINGIFRY